MTEIAKTSTVMHVSTKTRMMVGNTIPFDCDADGRDHHFFLDKTVWEDLGSPETITVTVEIGDKLNEEES